MRQRMLKRILIAALAGLAMATGGLTVLAGRIAPALHGALLGQAAGALEEQLGAFAPTLPAARFGIA